MKLIVCEMLDSAVHEGSFLLRFMFMFQDTDGPIEMVKSFWGEMYESDNKIKWDINCYETPIEKLVTGCMDKVVRRIWPQNRTEYPVFNENSLGMLGNALAELIELEIRRWLQ